MNFKNISHLFIPHPETHKKAHLLSWHCLIIYILLFIFLKVGLDLVGIYKPGVLGVDSTITTQQIIDDTNIERAKNNLSPLVENQNLSNAAKLKAQNMFAENYWAHFSPSGKNPWGFMLSSGYKFSFAGENLARNFSNSEDVVTAWMNSPSHKENIVNSKYQDIGVAVAEGNLNGQKTVLVVQMFGKPYEGIASAPEVNVGDQKLAVTDSEITKDRPMVLAGTTLNENLNIQTINPYSIIKTFGVGMIAFIGFLIALDFIILKRRGVFRFSSHHLAHLSFLGLAGTSMFLIKVGEIL
ncbi:MAG: CAP domain-containing protein [Candidatus Staskawiczbacteria bacterium]|nr:CAP domain-containing protein [Candidatus Staskawiczbacteria bacterium]